MNNKPKMEERLMAAIAHGSLVASGLGILVGVVVWLTQKGKSAYAARQGLQAAVYQLLGMIGIIGAWFVWGIFFTVSFIPIISNPDLYSDAPPPIFWVGMGAMIIPFVLMAIWGLYGLYGAWMCWRGEDFNYWLIGRRLPDQ